MNLYKVCYNLVEGCPPKYVLANDKAEAIQKSLPRYEDGSIKGHFTKVEVDLLIDKESII